MWKVIVEFVDAPTIEFWSKEIADSYSTIVYWDTNDKERVSYPVSRIKSFSEKYYEDKK